MSLDLSHVVHKYLQQLEEGMAKKYELDCAEDATFQEIKLSEFRFHAMKLETVILLECN